MWKKIATISYLLPIAAALMALPGHVLADQTTVHGARIWNAPDHTRIVLDIAAPIRYQIFPLDDPPRLVVDLTDARLKGKLPGVDSDDVLVSGLRGEVDRATQPAVTVSVSLLGARRAAQPQEDTDETPALRSVPLELDAPALRLFGGAGFVVRGRPRQHP